MKKIVILVILSLLMLALWACTDSTAADTESTAALSPVDRLNRGIPHIDGTGRTVLDSSSRRETLPVEGIRKDVPEAEKKLPIQTEPDPTLGYIEDPQPITLPEHPSGESTEAPLRAVGG